MRWHSYQSPLAMRKDESAVVGRDRRARRISSITITSEQEQAEAEEEL